MPTWGFILIGVLGVVATIATTPLWVWVMTRSKVRFDSDPITYWSFTQDDDILIVVDINLVNQGREETGIPDIALHISNWPVGATSEAHAWVFSPELLFTKDRQYRIAGNGGVLQAKIPFSLTNPGVYTLQGYTQTRLTYFRNGSNCFGEVKITPAQNRRLLWGKTQIIKRMHVEWVTYTELAAWAERSIMPPALQSETDSNGE